MEKMKDLFENFLSSEDYVNAVDTEGIDEKDFAILEEIKRIVGKESYLKIEILIDCMNIRREEFGFVNGSRYIMQLMTECVPQIAKSKVGDVA